MKRPVFD